MKSLHLWKKFWKMNILRFKKIPWITIEWPSIIVKNKYTCFLDNFFFRTKDTRILFYLVEHPKTKTDIINCYS